MARLLIGLAFAFGAAVLYAAGIALQALESREAPEEHALRMSLFRRLVARPRWIAGTAVGLLGWALQALALTRAPLTLVQPAVATSLVFLLAIGARVLGERVDREEVAIVFALNTFVPVALAPLLAREAWPSALGRLAALVAALAVLAACVVRLARSTSVDRVLAEGRSSESETGRSPRASSAAITRITEA